MELYNFPQETWDKATCERKANHLATDELGTPYPFMGYLGSWATCPPIFGVQRYNGGCWHNGKWYIGEYRPFPNLARGFKIIKVPAWGWQIVKE